jgi:hypothetical protein
MKEILLDKAHRLPYPIKNLLKNFRDLYHSIIINQIQQMRYPRVNRDPIIIYQMGKVGSMTVEQSLIHAYQKLNIRIPIYRRHILNNFDLYEKTARSNRPNIADTMAELDEGRKLRKIIDRELSTRWKIISLVREPLAKTIAAFFQLLHEFFLDWERQYEEGILTSDVLHEFF